MIRVADYIMERIHEVGVNHVFYIPGAQCAYLVDGLRRCEGLEPIAMHHEQAAAMAALSYSLYNENLGVCLVTTGCAGTNTMTGVLHAWQDSIPCLFLSGQQNLENTVKGSGLPLRQVGIQEADIETIMSPITKYAVTITDAADVAYHLDQALYLAKHGRPGPVWLDIPMNIQNTMVEETRLRRYYGTEERIEAEEQDLDAVATAISQAERPILLVGHGVQTAHAKQALRSFVKKYKIPAVFTRYAYDTMPYDDELNMGIVSGASGASRYANFAVQNSDLVLSLASKLSIETTGAEREKFAREAKIMVVDIDKVEHSKKGVRIDRFIYADVKDFLEKMIEKDVKPVSEAWLNTCRHWKDIFWFHPELSEENGRIPVKYFVEKLSEAMPDGSVLLSDAGFTGAAVSAAVHTHENDRILVSYSQGEMGYAVPGACGVATLTNQPVIAIEGDGSMMMNIQELQTIKRNQFNLKVVITSNNGYSSIRHGQKALLRGKYLGADKSNGVDFPEYEKISEAFGIKYIRIRNIHEIEAGLQELFSDTKPCICEVMSDPDEFDLHLAFVKYDKNKLGFRPIEDQSPFIEREVFFREMIVQPMEESSGKPI